MSDFVEVARLVDLAEGTMRAVVVGDADILLAHVDGRIQELRSLRSGGRR